MVRTQTAIRPSPARRHVWLSGVDHRVEPPDGVDVVVSLCRLGVDVPGPVVKAGDHVELWLIDDTDADKNPNFDFVLQDAASAVAAFRAEGRSVLLHCVQAKAGPRPWQPFTERF